MSTTDKTLAELVQELPPDMREEVRDFVEFLLSRRESRQRSKMQQNWAGALRDYRERYTSLELEKQALLWREQ